MVYNNLDFRTLRCKTGATIPKCPERLCKVRTFCLICNALLPHILQFFSVFPPFFQNADYVCLRNVSLPLPLRGAARLFLITP